MDIDKKQLDKMASMEDSEFRKRLESALDSAGAAPEVKSRLAGNIPLLKQTLGSLTQRDLETLVQKIDSDTLEKIKKSLEE